MLSSSFITRVAASKVTGIPSCVGAFRNHMNHGGGGDLMAGAAPPTESGPRKPLELGLDAARATQNILRLLESSTHGVVYSDTLDTIWHSSGKVWVRNTSDVWKALSPQEAQEEQKTLQFPPRLEWLNMTDDRTALAKIQGMDGVHKYVSMLRMDSSRDSSMMVANDGWQIVRQVNGSNEATSTNKIDSITSVHSTLQEYFSIEHGGGNEDAMKTQEDLFAPQASLLAVGTAPLDEPPTDWSAPSGSFLEISLDTYLKGVYSQTPHSAKSKIHDKIVQIDLLPCQTAAAATVHVGNGAQSLVFVDYLLLGRYGDGEWKILSKTFTPRMWPRGE